MRDSWIEGQRYKVLYFLLLQLLFPLDALGLSGMKPNLVVISYGRLPNSVTKDWDTGVQFDMFLGTLLGCGIEPITVDDVPLSNLASELRSKNIPPGTIVLLNAHGFVAPDGTYQVGSRFSSAGWMSGDKLIDIVINTLEDPRLWLGSCHSGACTVHYQCLGAECLASQASSVNLEAFRVISELLCDGYRGDCSLWQKADLDRDGRLRSDEIDAYLANRGSGWRNMPVTASGQDSNAFRLALQTLAAQCRALKGKLKPKSKEKAKWDLRYEQDGKSQNRSQVIPSNLLDSSLVEGFLASQYPDFPRTCGKTESGSIRRNCSIALLELRQSLECDADKAPMACLGDDLETLDDFYLPRVGTFWLESKRCAEYPAPI